MDAHVAPQQHLAALAHDAVHAEQLGEQAPRARGVRHRDHAVVGAPRAREIRAEVRDQLRARAVDLAQLEAARCASEVGVDLLLVGDRAGAERAAPPRAATRDLRSAASPRRSAPACVAFPASAMLLLRRVHPRRTTRARVDRTRRRDRPRPPRGSASRAAAQGGLRHRRPHRQRLPVGAELRLRHLLPDADRRAAARARGRGAARRPLRRRLQRSADGTHLGSLPLEGGPAPAVLPDRRPALRALLRAALGGPRRARRRARSSPTTPPSSCSARWR